MFEYLLFYTESLRLRRNFIMSNIFSSQSKTPQKTDDHLGCRISVHNSDSSSYTPYTQWYRFCLPLNLDLESSLRFCLISKTLLVMFILLISCLGTLIHITLLCVLDFYVDILFSHWSPTPLPFLFEIFLSLTVPS